MDDVPVDEINNENESSTNNIIVPEEEDQDKEESQEELEPTESEPQQDEEPKAKLTKLPIGRIRNIMKTDPDVNLINQEAVFLITKATELFIDCLAKESFKYTCQAKKKTIQKHDVQSAIDNVDALVFLDGM